MGGQFTGANRIVAVVPEATPGVYQEPQASDYNIELYDAAALSFERNPVRLGKPAVGNLMQGRSKIGKISSTGYSIKTSLKHSGNKTQIPALDKLFLAAGLWRQIGPDGGVVYFYDGTQPCQTLSVCATEFNCGRNPNAISARGRGAVANMVINGSGIGELLDVTFELSMAYDSESDAVSYTKVLSGQDGGQPEKLLGVTFMINNQAYCLHGFSLNLNNEISEVADPSKPGGVYQYKVVGSDPTLTATVQQLTLSESQFMVLLERDLDTDAETVTISGRAFDIVIDKANLRNLSIGDASGINTNELEVEVRGLKLIMKDYSEG